MKKIKGLLVGLLALVVLVGCGSKDESEPVKKATTDSDALMYTFKMDKKDYRFRLLDGWIKFPDKDSTIAFLVANKDIKSFMTAGFEEKEGKSLETYEQSFLEKVEKADGTVTVKPEERDLNGLDSYYLGYELKDGKDRTLTYRTYLIETSDYFINLGAWTSEEKPTKEIINILDEMLGNFEILK